MDHVRKGRVSEENLFKSKGSVDVVGAQRVQLGINEHLASAGETNNGDSMARARRWEREREREKERGAPVGKPRGGFMVPRCFVLAKYCRLCVGRVPVARRFSAPVCHFCLPSACLFPTIVENYTERDRWPLAPTGSSPRITRQLLLKSSSIEFEGKFFTIERLFLDFWKRKEFVRWRSGRNFNQWRWKIIADNKTWSFHFWQSWVRLFQCSGWDFFFLKIVKIQRHLKKFLCNWTHHPLKFVVRFSSQHFIDLWTLELNDTNLRDPNVSPLILLFKNPSILLFKV